MIEKIVDVRRKEWLAANVRSQTADDIASISESASKLSVGTVRKESRRKDFAREAKK